MKYLIAALAILTIFICLKIISSPSPVVDHYEGQIPEEQMKKHQLDTHKSTELLIDNIGTNKQAN